jgi:hypothetical protein
MGNGLAFDNRYMYVGFGAEEAFPQYLEDGVWAWGLRIWTWSFITSTT